MSRKLIITFVVIAFFVGALGSVFFNRVIFPNLASVKGFAWVGKLQSNAPIVISRREEVRLNEGVNLIELTKQAQTVVVSIYSGANQRYLGNGLIITSDGTIFTTKEVVGNNTQVTIITNDGAIHQGQVRAMDPKSPLAIVSVSAQNLPVVQFSDAGNMQTAQRVFALGKTNQEFTRIFATGMVTKNLANQLDPDRLLSTEVFENIITTDADLTVDYVGGPVVNLQGLIIGMVSGANGQILTSESMEGAMKTYLENGKVMRPFIGLKYLMVSSNIAKLKNLPSGGAQVQELDVNSPAARSGLVVGDLVIEVNGQKVGDSSFEQLIISQNSNDIKLKVRRAGQEIDLNLKPELR